jgi:MFS family permease
MSGIIAAPAFNNLFTATRDNPSMQGFVTAIYEIGCLFGAILVLTIGDLVGRRRAIIAGGLISKSLVGHEQRGGTLHC